MGVLSGIDNAVRTATDATLDNDVFSVQDTVRGTVSTATGAGEGGEDDFSEDSSRFFKGIGHTIAKPGRMVGQATDDTVIDNQVTSGAVQGGEALWGLTAGWAGSTAYATATGANINKRDPSQATGNWSPGALTVAEGALTLGTGGGGKAATTAGKAVARKMPKLGALKGIVPGGKRVLGKADDVAPASAADDTAKTAVEQSADYAPTRIGKSESLVDPSRTTSAAEASISGAARELLPSKKGTAVLGGGAGLLGIMGFAGPPALPPNHERERQYNGPITAVRLKKKDNAGNTLGYYLALGNEGGEWSLVEPSNGGFNVRKVDLPTSGRPTFESPEQVDTAYERFVAERANGEQAGNHTQDHDTTPDQAPWKQPEIFHRADLGWYILSQDHRSKDKTRYIVAGRTGDGSMMYLDRTGSARSEAVTFDTLDKAEEAYSKWAQSYQNGSANRTPDGSQDRPRPEQIQSDLKGESTSSGLGSIVTTIATGGGIAVLAFLIWRYL